MREIEISVPQIQIRSIYSRIITAGTDVMNFCGFSFVEIFFLLQDMKI